MTDRSEHPSNFDRDGLANGMIVRRDALISILRDMEQEVVAQSAFGRECSALNDFRDRLADLMAPPRTTKA